METITITNHKQYYGQNEPINIICNANGSPEVSYKWYKVNAKIADSPILTNQLMNIDEGYYICKATNGYDVITKSIFIRIECKFSCYQTSFFCIITLP